MVCLSTFILPNTVIWNTLEDLKIFGLFVLIAQMFAQPFMVVPILSMRAVKPLVRLPISAGLSETCCLHMP